MYQYELVLGLPHTNYLGLAEHLLLMHAGHLQWTSIARAIGRPLSSLRTANGQEVYGTFYFIEEQFPAGARLNTFRLDDRVTFAVFLRGFKGISVEGQIVFDHHDRLAAWLASAPAAPAADVTARHPFIRFANIFITPEAGNSQLKVAAPVGASLADMPALRLEESPYALCQAARDSGSLGLRTDEWQPLDAGDFAWEYVIDRERDTNGAGLVYFANYVTYMNTAERMAMQVNTRRRFSGAEIAGRAVERRRVAYYGNVATDDRVRTRVKLFQDPRDASRMLSQLEIRRDQDDQMICLSEAIKVLVS